MKVNTRIWRRIISPIEASASAAINRVAPISINDAMIARRIVRRQQILAYFRTATARGRALHRFPAASRSLSATRHIFDTRA